MNSMRMQHLVYTFVLPVLLTTDAVFVFGYFTYHPPAEYANTIELWAGLLFFGACCAGVEILARFGFRLLGYARRAVRLNDSDKAVLSTACAPGGAGDAELLPTAVELGDIVLVHASPFDPHRLYISTVALRSLPAYALRVQCLAARRLQAADTMLERVLYSAVPYWLCALPVLLLTDSMLIAALATLPANGVVIAAHLLRLRRLQRAALG